MGRVLISASAYAVLAATCKRLPEQARVQSDGVLVAFDGATILVQRAGRTTAWDMESRKMAMT
jgi:hypothetical protein